MLPAVWRLARCSSRSPGRAAALLARGGGAARPALWARAESTAPPARLLYPDPPRAVRHHDLASFLRHAERTGLDPASTTYVGTRYEYTVAAHLAPLGFALRRVGGASDRGIDLLGTWTLPLPVSEDDASPPPPIRVLLQCKAGAGQRVGPHLVRELEGAFVGAPAGWKSRTGDGSDSGRGGCAGVIVIGLLVTEKPATKGIRDALARSRWPMAYVCCSDAGHVRQMLWNQPAERGGGLAGLGVTLRHAPDAAAGSSSGHVVLTWQGQPLPRVTSPDA